MGMIGDVVNTIKTGAKRVTRAQLLELMDKCEKAILDLRSRLREAQSKIEFFEEHHRRLVADINFWKDQSAQYANQLQVAWDAQAKLHRQVANESGAKEHREYARLIEQNIEAMVPKPAEIAAVIARSARDTQGLGALGFVPHQARPMLGSGEIIDVD